MDFVNKQRSTKYDRVMSRLYNRSRSTVDSSSNVTRHRTLSSARVGAKASSSNLSSGVFSELPVVLNDYVPETPVKKTFVVKPRRTIKSLDPAKSPQQVLRPEKPVVQSPYVRARGSAPSVLYRSANKWSDEHYRECLSSRSHTRVKELKNEIHEYQERDKLMKLRSRLYKSCGVVLDDVGHVAQDKAVQAEPPPETDKESEKLRRNEWISLIGRPDLRRNPNLRNKSYSVCSAHFDESLISVHIIRKLHPDATPTKFLPGQPDQKDKPTVSKPVTETSNSISTQTEDLFFNRNQSSKEPEDTICDVNTVEREMNLTSEIKDDFDLDCDLNIVKKEIDYDSDMEQSCDLNFVKTAVDPMANYKNSSFTNDATAVQDQDEEKAQETETENVLLRKLLKTRPRKMAYSKSQMAEKRKRLLEYELSQVKNVIEGKSKDPVPSTSGSDNE